MNKLIQIQVRANDPEMRMAFEDGLEHYQPVVFGLALDEESGVTQISTENIHKIMKSCGKVVSFEAGLNMGVLVSFENGTEYLATGFGWSYAGGGPSGLARLAEEVGFGSLEKNRNYLCGLEKPYVGKLFA